MSRICLFGVLYRLARRLQERHNHRHHREGDIRKCNRLPIQFFLKSPDRIRAFFRFFFFYYYTLSTDTDTGFFF